MTHFIIAVLLLLLLAGAYVFYDRFTKRGAIPLAKAWRDYTSWLSLLGIALAEWIVELLRYMADLWAPAQQQFGALLDQPSLTMLIQLMSFVFMALKLKGQTPLPRPSLPDMP